MAWAGATVLQMMYGGLAWLSDTTLDGDQARNLVTLINVGFAGVLFLLGVGALASGLVLAARTGASRIIGWVGVLAAILAGAATFAWAGDGFFSPGQAIFPPYLLTMVYLLAVSVLMVREK
jgi:hypothetical protein